MASGALHVSGLKLLAPHLSATNGDELRCTIDRACRDTRDQAQALLRHRVPDGNLGAIVKLAMERAHHR